MPRKIRSNLWPKNEIFCWKEFAQKTRKDTKRWSKENIVRETNFLAWPWRPVWPGLCLPFCNRLQPLSPAVSYSASLVYTASFCQAISFLQSSPFSLLHKIISHGRVPQFLPDKVRLLRRFPLLLIGPCPDQHPTCLSPHTIISSLKTKTGSGWSTFVASVAFCQCLIQRMSSIHLC